MSNPILLPYYGNCASQRAEALEMGWRLESDANDSIIDDMMNAIEKLFGRESLNKILCEIETKNETL